MGPKPAKITTGAVAVTSPIPVLVQAPAAVGWRGFVTWMGWCIVLLVPVAVVGVALKWTVVVGRESPRLAAMMFRTEATISLEEKLTFIRSDLLMGFLILPAALALATWLLPKRLRYWLVGSIGALALGVETAQSASFATVGKFLSWGLASDAIQWGFAHPADMKSYV